MNHLPPSGQQMRWLFLDIEGVLVPKTVESARKSADLIGSCKFDQSCLNRFENVLRKNPEVLIGITSAWKIIYHFSQVKPLFSSDIRERIIGYTPTLNPINNQWVRYREIIQFLDVKGELGALWVALDDRTRHFSYERGDPVVIVENGEIGLTDEDCIKLDKKINNR
jgi:hypothetical protein